MRLFSVVLIAILGVGLASPPAHAESTSKRLDDMNARLEKIERVISNQTLLEMAQHLDEVQNDLRQMRGKIEELENQVQQLKKQKAAPPPPPPAAVAPPPAPTPAVAAGPGAAPAASKPADGEVTVDQTVYSQAFDALKAGSYSTATIGFKDFVASYPNSPLVANAQYWLGQSYFMSSDYTQAAGAFRQLLERWPDDRRAPDAMLRLSDALRELKKGAESRALLVQVTQKYPGTDAAKQAAERLQSEKPTKGGR